MQLLRDCAFTQAYELTKQTLDASPRAAQDIAERQREVEAYEHEVLDPSRERLNHPNNPPSLDELAEIRRRLEENMPQDVRAGYERPNGPPAAARPSTAAAEYLGDTALKAPNVTSEFQSARAPDAKSPGDSSVPTTIPKPP